MFSRLLMLKTYFKLRIIVDWENLEQYSTVQVSLHGDVDLNCNGLLKIRNMEINAEIRDHHQLPDNKLDNKLSQQFENSYQAQKSKKASKSPVQETSDERNYAEQSVSEFFLKYFH